MGNKFRYNVITFIVLIVDAAIIYSSYLIGMLLKFGTVFDHEVYEELKLVMVGLTVLGMATIYIYDLYNDLYKSNEEIIISVLMSVAITGGATLFYIFLDDRFVFSRFVIIYALAIQGALLSLWHIVIHYWMIKNHGLIQVLIVGDLDEAKHVGMKLLSKYKNRYEIKYIVSRDAISKVYTLVDEVEVVVICSNLFLEEKDYIRNLASSNGKSVFIIPKVYDISVRHTKWQQFDDLAVLSLSNLGISSAERFVKRFIDILVSSLGLILLSPLLVFTALWIRIDSKGPILFKQTRLTRGAKEFVVYKFRTMIPDAEKNTGAVLATKGDSRITKAGVILRKSRLDELPQLLNVFLGHMSLVGPRPERPILADAILKDVPHFEYRLSVKAGLTGMAQVMGSYDTGAEDKLRFDLMYINNYSLFLDFKIILQTLKVIFMGEKAGGVDKEKNTKYLSKLSDIIEYTKKELS